MYIGVILIDEMRREGGSENDFTIKDVGDESLIGKYCSIYLEVKEARIDPFGNAALIEKRRECGKPILVRTILLEK